MRCSGWIVATAALAIAGCASGSREPPRAPRSTGPIVREAPVSAATYVAQAASIDLFVVRSAELAQSRASDGRVRAFASQMLAAHQGLAAQLSFAGRRLDLLPSATLLPQHQLMLDELRASSNFDGTYRRQQLAVHGTSLRLHQEYSVRGGSATLRPVASNAAAVERVHLDMLRGL